MAPRLGFSTLACPNWSWETVIHQAQQFGYDTIEWRGGDEGHVQPVWTRSERAALKERVRDAGLASLAVTSYTSFTSPRPVERDANLRSLQAHLDLAADIGAPYVRVFLGELEPGQPTESVHSQVMDCLQRALPHARSVGVTMAVEHHDDFIRTASLVPLLSALPDPCLCAVWDIANAWSAGESPAEGARNLGGRIGYVQVKDGVGRRPSWRLTSVGAGEVPLREAFALLRAQAYAGAFSVEWEYAWHPELPPPETELPRAAAWLHEALPETHTP